MYRSEVSIPVLEAASAFSRGVTLTEAFRLWQVHNAKQGMRYKAVNAQAAVCPASSHPLKDLRRCA